MSPLVKKRLALAAFLLMTLSVVVTVVRPRLPGVPISRAEVIAVAIQIVLAVVAYRKYRE